MREREKQKAEEVEALKRSMQSGMVSLLLINQKLFHSPNPRIYDKLFLLIAKSFSIPRHKQ